MNVRSLEWRDLSFLHRYRNECIFLNSALELTRGPLFVPTGAILSTLANATGLFTYLCEADHQAHSKMPFVGQVSHPAGSASAQLTFFTPGSGLACERVAGLVEQMLPSMGKRGVLHILAEVEEQSEALAALRQVGFGIYARQSIWKLDRSPSRGKEANREWRSAGKQHEAGIRFLYSNLVPGLVQQVEILPSGRLSGLVYYRGSEILAYVDLEYGLRGILAQPFVHPDAEQVAESLVSLLRWLPDLYSRPVYVRVRSYQSWLDSVLAAFGAGRISQQVVLVRHLVVKLRALKNVTVPVLNGSTPEPTVPVAQIETK